MSDGIGRLYPILSNITLPFREELGPGLCDLDDFEERQLPEPYLGQLTLCILELVEHFEVTKRVRYPNNAKEKLRAEILALYDADWSHWWGFNSVSKKITDKQQQDPFHAGIQCSCFVLFYGKKSLATLI